MAAIVDRPNAPLRVGPEDVLARVAQHGDLFGAVLTSSQVLPASLD